MDLRNYQTAGLTDLNVALLDGERSILLVSPTGSGKTVILSHAVLDHLQHGGTVNWYAHRRELIAQAEQTLRSIGITVGVRLMTVQAALAAGEVPSATLGVFDEAHHFGEGAVEWTRLTKAHAGGIILGATATPQRGDGTALSPPFGHLIVVAQMGELVRDGCLVPVDLIRPKSKLKSGQIAQRPVDDYLRHTPGKSAVVFAPNIKSAYEYSCDFAAAGIVAPVVHGETGTLERESILSEFAGGDIRVVINVMVLTEGWDCPRTEVVIIGRSVGTVGMYLQMAGRAMRLFPGKTSCTVIDLVGCSYHPSFGFPDEYRIFSLDGEGITRAKSAALSERLCRICGTPLGDETTCAECGADHETMVPEVVGVPTDRYARLTADDGSKRVDRLRKWILDARVKGYKMGWALGKFKGVYGDWPTREMISAASRSEAA